MIVGTVAYMSPEQAEGKKVDSRSDIFSFGSVLYEMFTGRRAFQGETKASTIAAILKEDPKPASQLTEALPRELELVITRCLRKDRERRTQHLDDVKLALLELKEESDSGKLAAAPPAKPTTRPRLLGAFGLLLLLMFAGLASWFLRSKTKNQEASPTTIPLTTYSGRELYPSFSPDGNQVAFSWDGEKQDNLDIYIKLIGPGEPLQLTTDPAADYSPAWSPDGRSIAFLRHLEGDKAAVLVIPALGGAERKLAEINAEDTGWDRDLAWFPDSKWVAFADQGGIWALSIETGEKQRLTSPPAQSYDSSPAFAPDGHMLAFIRGDSGFGEVYIQALSESLTPRGEAKRLTDNQAANSCPVWTTDGQDIVFASGVFRTTLWRVAASGSRKQQRLAFGDEGSSLPSVSRLGHRLAYVRTVSDSNIWRIELSSSGSKNNSSSNFIHSTLREQEPQYSPDGKRIVFVSNRSGSDEIWVCNSDGSRPTQLTSLGGAHNGAPRWSPDGKHITFDSYLEGLPNIYVVSADGGKPQRLTGPPSGNVVSSWSRDGKWIYFMSGRTGKDQVWKMPASGGQPVQVTKKGGIGAFESPDGRFLYYAKEGGGPTSLWKVAVEGGEEGLVLEPIASWSHLACGNQGIYFLPRLDMSSRTPLEFFDFATNKVKTLANVDKPGIYGLTVSPDGRFVLYTRLDQQGSDLMLVENFR
jgi:Tol biopolymer transport system component